MKLTVEEKINESSFTSVYRAFDTVLQRRVLLKVLHKHLASDNDLHQRFLREARACAALHSDHIVQVYELIEYEGAPAILMEYVEGTSLKNFIADGKTTSLKFTRKAALHTLRGLVAAHDEGIIHRDIKPGNILVTAAFNALLSAMSGTGSGMSHAMIDAGGIVVAMVLVSVAAPVAAAFLGAC